MALMVMIIMLAVVVVLVIVVEPVPVLVEALAMGAVLAGDVSHLGSGCGGSGVGIYTKPDSISQRCCVL